MSIDTCENAETNKVKKKVTNNQNPAGVESVLALTLAHRSAITTP